MTYLFDEHVVANIGGNHTFVLIEELSDPVPQNREYGHQIFDYLQINETIAYNRSADKERQSLGAVTYHFSTQLHIAHWTLSINVVIHKWDVVVLQDRVIIPNIHKQACQGKIKIVSCFAGQSCLLSSNSPMTRSQYLARRASGKRFSRRQRKASSQVR